jgi:integrase
VAALRVGDLQPLADGKLSLTFQRCKGGKVLEDQLPVPVADALHAWIRLAYGHDLLALPPEAPVWISLSLNGQRTEPLRHRALAVICRRRLGVSELHRTRHTFAHAMETAGASPSEIQRRLGHSSLGTTGIYLSALRKAENRHSGAIAELLGLDGVTRDAALAETPRRSR